VGDSSGRGISYSEETSVGDGSGGIGGRGVSDGSGDLSDGCGVSEGRRVGEGSGYFSDGCSVRGNSGSVSVSVGRSGISVSKDGIIGHLKYFF